MNDKTASTILAVVALCYMATFLTGCSSELYLTAGNRPVDHYSFKQVGGFKPLKCYFWSFHGCNSASNNDELQGS